MVTDLFSSLPIMFTCVLFASSFSLVFIEPSVSVVSLLCGFVFLQCFSECFVLLKFHCYRSSSPLLVWPSLRIHRDWLLFTIFWLYSVHSLNSWPSKSALLWNTAIISLWWLSQPHICIKCIVSLNSIFGIYLKQ